MTIINTTFGVMRSVTLILSLFLISLTTLAQTDSVPKEPEIFQIVETLPEFPGGRTGQQRFVSENFKIPKDVRDSIGTIRMFVQFTVDTLGCVQDIKVRGNNLTPSLEAAGEEVIRKMKCYWTPGTQRGKKVRVRMTQPITVRID